MCKSCKCHLPPKTFPTKNRKWPFLRLPILASGQTWNSRLDGYCSSSSLFFLSPSSKYYHGNKSRPSCYKRTFSASNTFGACRKILSSIWRSWNPKYTCSNAPPIPSYSVDFWSPICYGCFYAFTFSFTGVTNSPKNSFRSIWELWIAVKNRLSFEFFDREIKL